MRNAGLDEAQAGIKIARRTINNLRHVDDTTLMAESEEELKVKVKEEKVTVYMILVNRDMELDMEQQSGSKLGKEYIKAVYCHPAYLTYMQSTS